MAAQAVEESGGAQWPALMATPAASRSYARGFAAELPCCSGNDLVLAVRAVDADAVDAALESGRRIALDAREQPILTARLPRRREHADVRRLQE
jgi:hypothetical protein